LLSQPEVLWARRAPPGASWDASLVVTVFIAALGHPPRRRRLLPGCLPPSGGRRCPLFNDGRDVRAPVGKAAGLVAAGAMAATLMPLLPDPACDSPRESAQAIVAFGLAP